MTLESRPTVLGVIPLDLWKSPRKRIGFKLDGESLTHQILLKKEKIIESMKVEGNGVLVTFSILQESGDYRRFNLAYLPDETDELNKVLKSGLIYPQFRNKLPKAVKHF